MAYKEGNKPNGYWKTYMFYYIEEYATYYTLDIEFGILGLTGHGNTMSLNTYTIACTGQTTTTKTMSGGEKRIHDGENYSFGSKSYKISKTTSSATINFSVKIVHGGSSTIKGTSTVSASFTRKALASYAVKYNANGGSGAPAQQTKWYGSTLKLSTAKPTRTNYTFKGWATSSSGSVAYASGANYTANAAATLYAVWAYTPPPSFNVTNLHITAGRKNGNSAITGGFSTISCGVSGITVTSGRSISSAIFKFGSATYSATTAQILAANTNKTLTFTTGVAPWSTFPSAGTYTASIEVTDSAGAKTSKSVGSISIVNPTWSYTTTVNSPPPAIVNGDALLSEIKIYNYETDEYETGTAKVSGKKLDNESWELTYVFDSDHVSALTVDATVSIKGMTYEHYETYEKDYRKAFFSTTRNQNFSNGVYNVEFVSGVSAIDQPNYTSRVWWSYYNDPLYFPDTNYAEVGSNDTAVMGLTKVGSYLGAIKQSKTTDTAIYLLYPTSFEEETTYAVKQGVQGVGALGKYTFNILGDEALFLSPNGIMSVVPTDDEEHKVQNRSYFIDGKLLKEENLDTAYSFVYDGKYWLAVNDRCYVLDGNQRNSWGNDKTVLVYEGYYLENVPANCFVKFNDRLVFSNDNDVCVFNDGFVDAYNGGLDDVPVSAEWSTILDDDGALQYYKTMQKKGNLVSILPTDYKYMAVTITEDEFDQNKTIYFVKVGDDYVRCSTEDGFDEEATYYIRGRSNTKVFVRKDNNEPVEIQRKFGESSQIPSEMILNKKFKKYKRLQFIIRNEENEPFGVDEIIKNYTVGNYAKK